MPKIVLEKAPPPSDLKPKRVRVSAAVAEGLVRKYVKPIYPDEAKKNRVQGMVVFKALLSRDGDVKTLDVVSGDPGLAAAAMEAVKQWKYKPYSINGYPVEVETQIKVDFQISGH